MFFEEILLNGQSSKPLYKQLEEAVIQGIREKRLTSGYKIPSIRQLTAILNVSKPTVENALKHLTNNGYLIAKDRSGFVVSNIPTAEIPIPLNEITSSKKQILFDFRNNAVDSIDFPAQQWRRSVSRAAKKKNFFSSYGDPAGELELRKAIASYSAQSRGVVCNENQIVIGAGIQSLLPILIRLLKRSDSVVYFHQKPSPHPLRIFEDHLISTQSFSFESLPKARNSILYMDTGTPLSVNQLKGELRTQLLEWTGQCGHTLIEDDYLGEFRSLSDSPTSLQGLFPGGRLIYLGSFSRLLTPALRLSFMVLPLALIQEAREILNDYNQTASTLEQLALADFIESGQMRKHVRLLKAKNAKKISILSGYLDRLPSQAFSSVETTGYGVQCLLPTSKIPLDFEDHAEKYGLGIRVSRNNGTSILTLAVSAINMDSMGIASERLIQLLSDTLFPESQEKNSLNL